MFGILGDIFGVSGTREPVKPTRLPPPPRPAVIRYAPLFNYITVFSGKELGDDDKITVITLAQAGIAPKWPPDKE